MDLFSLPAGVTAALLAIMVIAATGCIAALQSWTRITAEKKRVQRAGNALTGDAAWEAAYPHDKFQLASWLRSKGIKEESHLGDFIRTCWSAWLGGRPASLTELHVLVARRERSYRSSRLSAGIAALLLVCGIVGTLSAIKPVLGNFSFDVAKSQSTQTLSDDPKESLTDMGIDESTARVNKLIHDLGDAFWPSLLALLGTIAVVSCRGLYSLSLHDFTLELDRFAVDTLIPRYRVPSLSEQYQEVKATLASVAETLVQREGRFHEAVGKLEALVVGISPALTGMDAAASASKDAADVLASGAASISEALTQHLGAKSTIHRAIKGLDLVFEKTEQSLTNLSSIVEGIGQSNTTSQEKLGDAIKALGQSVEKIGEDHQWRQSESAKALEHFKESMVGIPAAIQTTGENAVNAGLAAMKSSIDQLSDEQKKWHSASAEELKAATTAGLAGVTKAGQDLAAHAGRVATAATGLGNIKTDVGAALKELTESSKAQISQIADASKSKVETASAKLAVDAEKFGKAVELLTKPQKEPSSLAGSGKWAPPERNTPIRPGFMDDREPVSRRAPPPTIVLDSKTPEPSAVVVSVPIENPQSVAPQTENAALPQAPHSSPMPSQQTLPQTSVDPSDTLGGNAADPGPQPKGKWWSRIPNPFSGKNS